MHASLLPIAVAAVAASALIAPSPPQITQAPVIKAILEPRLAFDVGRRVQILNKSQPSEDEYPPGPWDIVLCDSIYNSIVNTDIPRMPAGGLYSWAERQPSTTITAISDVDAACADPDAPDAPSLLSSYSSRIAEIRSWRQTVHDAVHSTALHCGMLGPYFDTLVARDEAECRIAMSAVFGVATGSPSSHLAEPTLTSETFDVENTGTSTPEADSTLAESFSRSTPTTKVEVSSPKSTGAAARPMETGFMVAAAAMAGVAGVFAAL